MSRLPRLTSRHCHLATRLPESTPTVVAVLALYPNGMILSKVSGLGAASLFLSEYLRCTYFAPLERLSEF